jgi:rhamnogalacturonan endolyase
MNLESRMPFTGFKTMASGILACLGLGAASHVHAEFGAVTDDVHHTVETGAGLVFKVGKSHGGITSLQWNGVELCSAKGSHLASGLGSKGVVTRLNLQQDHAMITVETDETHQVVRSLKHYYMVRRGENTLYMATFAAHQPAVGELRWITRLQGSLFSKVPVESEIRGSNGAIESKDVFGMRDGTTRSKYYGNDRAKEMILRGVTGPGCGVFMVYGNRESSSGGPFFRDIQTQSGSDVELYNYMNSGHNQTEALRLGVLYGPYALCFTDGGKPRRPDMSFIAGLGLAGFVADSDRGAIMISRITGLDRRHRHTIALANSVAQYWADVTPETGAATVGGIKPGTYRLSLFKGELEIHRREVDVTSGEKTSIHEIVVTKDPSSSPPLWRVGDWDGTPLEFRNGLNISRMHPSDKRQKNWITGPFIIGRSRVDDFPACHWAAMGTLQIHFSLTQEQIATHTLRIGITSAFAAGRPMVQIHSWKPGKLPSPSAQPSSRSITIGTYRGNNTTYSYIVPADAFQVGRNILKIDSISGHKGHAFLSPGYAIDCVDMIRENP